jgi:hypothetical protein
MAPAPSSARFPNSGASTTVSLRAPFADPAGGITAIDIPARLRNVEFATCLVRRYLDDATGRARYSGAYFERIGGGGDQPESANVFTADDLLAVTMLSVRIEGYHALEILHYRADELNGLLSQIPPGVALQDSRAAAHIARDGPAWRLWGAVCDIEPRPESNRIGPIAAGKLLARKRPQLLPVYDSRIKKVLNRPRIDNQWWHDMHGQLVGDPGLIQELELVRAEAQASHMSLLRVFDVMCWMFSWEDKDGLC